MNEVLERLLAERYPIYRREEHPKTIFCDWGFECGPGWLCLFIALAEKIEAIGIDSADVRILQIKEKYWRLRIYLDIPAWADDEIEDFIETLEVKSGGLCESCGAPKLAEVNRHDCDPSMLSLAGQQTWYIANLIPRAKH